jgi:cytochrome oxidase Cu insertion factor (SCO1/SenC/PrrC family)
MARIPVAHRRRGAALPIQVRRSPAAWTLLLCVLASPWALAQQPPRHLQQTAEQGPPAPGTPGVITLGAVRREIPDLEVLDQDGRKVRFYSDLIQGRVVVVGLFFTRCTLTCPMQSQALARLRDGLTGRLGEDVFFVSISKDPAIDTPERLRRWGEEFGVGRGWTLVTDTEKLLRDLTGDGPGRQMHDPIVLIGNDRTGVWREADSLQATDDLVEIIDQVSGSGLVSPQTREADDPAVNERS